MARPGSDNRVLAKYVLFQVPGAVLAGLALSAAVYWWDLSALIAIGLFALWLVKDAVLYPFLRIAYESGSGTASDRLAGATAIAKQPLDPEGYVHVCGELWRARLVDGSAPVPRGAALHVRSVDGLTLVVEARSADPGGEDSGPDPSDAA